MHSGLAWAYEAEGLVNVTHYAGFGSFRPTLNSAGNYLCAKDCVRSKYYAQYQGYRYNHIACLPESLVIFN